MEPNIMVLEIQVKVEEQATHRFKHIVIPLSTKEFEMVERLGDVENGKPAYELVLKLIQPILDVFVIIRRQ